MTWPFLDARERALVHEALPLAGDDRDPLERQLRRLSVVADVTREGWLEVSAPALLERLAGCRYDADLRLPPAAALGEAYLLLKVMFLRDLARALDAAGAPPDLRRRADTELAQSIHSHLVEELFVAVASDAEVDVAVRQAAARKLLVLWRDPLHVEIDDVAPLLDAIWEARCRLRPAIGTLLGTQEVFALFQSTRDERFLDHFTRGDLPQAELEAYQEFLFGLSTEQCATLRSEMAARGLPALSPADARRLLGLPEAGDDAVGAVGPDAMVASYRARKVRASYRVLTGAPGPRRTAEEHVVIARLASGEPL